MFVVPQCWCWQEFGSLVFTDASCNSVGMVQAGTASPCGKKKKKRGHFSSLLLVTQSLLLCKGTNFVTMVQRNPTVSELFKSSFLWGQWRVGLGEEEECLPLPLFVPCMWSVACHLPCLKSVQGGVVFLILYLPTYEVAQCF